jgi:hypothetical protein
MNLNLDVAAVLGVIVWPLILLWILSLYRQRLPALCDGIVNRVQKVEVAGVAVELAVAKPVVPDWSAAPGGPDLRQGAMAMQVNDTSAATFRSELMDDRDADYALLNLGSGRSWLTSRLFIMAILFGQMKGIRCFAFVEGHGRMRKQYVGWADPDRIRWRLAQRYPWLERAYAAAYSQIMAPEGVVVMSHDGRLGSTFDHLNPGPRIQLLNAFLAGIQTPPPAPPGDAEEWVQIRADQPTVERATWINVDDLQEILDEDLHTETVSSRDVKGKGSDNGLQAIMAIPTQYVAVVGDKDRFDYLVDRARLLEQLAERTAMTRARDAAG